MNIVSISTSESLKSKILRRVREGETVQQDKQGQDQLPETELASERMNAIGQDIVVTRKQSLTRRNSRLTSPQKTGDNLRSLRSNSRTQVGQSPQKEQCSHDSEPGGTKGRARVPRGVPRARCSRGRQKAQIGRANTEALQRSSLGEAFGDSGEAKPRPTPVKRRLRSATSLVSAPLDKVRRVESAPDLSEQSTRSPSPNCTKASLVVPESPCCLMIVEKKSPREQRKVSVTKSAEAFCACTDGANFGSLKSMKSGTKKKSNVRQTKRKLDSCPGIGTLSKKKGDNCDLSRNGISKQKKKMSPTESHVANRPTRSSSKTKAGKISQVKRTSGSKNELIDSFKIQDFRASNSVVAAMSSVLSQPSSETVGKEGGSLVRELINERINVTLTTQDDQNDEVGTTNSLTVTKTAATEAAKAVGGISLMPLFKAASPDFLPTVSSPSTPTLTVMKASSDPIVSPTMSSESNLKNHNTQVSNVSQAPQLSLVSSSTSSGLQAVAQCKCVASVSTVPTPSLKKEVTSTTQAVQPIFLSQEAFQFQTVSFPGMVGYNLPDVNSSGRLPKLSKASKKRGTTKKKSVEKEPQSLVSSDTASASSSPVNVSSASTSSPPNPDTKDPSLDDNGEKIKRPMNAFMIWSRQQRSILATEIPKMTNAEISVKLGVMWNDLDYSVKQKYFDEAIQLKLQHRKDYPDWVYQPRPQKRQRRRRKHQPNPFYGDINQQMPYNQMVLVMPDGQRILCPAIPQQNCQGLAPMMANFASNLMPGAAKDGSKLKNISQPNQQAPKLATNKKDANIMPRPTLDGTDVKNSASGPSKQSKSEMVVLMPDGTSHQVLMCPLTSQQNCKESEPAMMTNITSTMTSGTQVDTKAGQKSIDKQHLKKSEMVLVTPDGKHVLCPATQGPSTDINDAKKSANQPNEQSKSSKEKLVAERSENSRNCGDEKCMITFKGKAGLSNPGPINLGPVIQLNKNVTSSTKEMAAPSVCIPEVKTVSSDGSSRQQRTGGGEKKFVTSLQMAVVKDKLGTSQGHTDPVVLIPQKTVPSNTSQATERKTTEAKTFPTVNATSIAQVQSSYKDGNNQSIAKTCDTVMMMLSNANQQGPLTGISSLLKQPVNNRVATQNVSNPLKKTDDSSKPHPADNSSGLQRRQISDDSSRPFLPDDSSKRFVPDNSSPFHPAVTLVPLNLQEPDLKLQPLIRDTGVQTLQGWSSSCSSNNNHNIVKLPSQLPSSVLKNQPIDMVWNTDPRIAQLPNISHKGTSTVSSYPFYFTPIQQAPAVQDRPTAPLLNPPALPATVDSGMVPLSTASITDVVPTDVGITSTQFADTPTLCEISEPDRLLESLAMSGVEISEDEAEETENLFQRVMNMVSD